MQSRMAITKIKVAPFPDLQKNEPNCTQVEKTKKHSKYFPSAFQLPTIALMISTQEFVYKMPSSTHRTIKKETLPLFLFQTFFFSAFSLRSLTSKVQLHVGSCLGYTATIAEQQLLNERGCLHACGQPSLTRVSRQNLLPPGNEVSWKINRTQDPFKSRAFEVWPFSVSRLFFPGCAHSS